MNQQASADHRNHLREYWLNPRRIRFWVVLLLLLYTLLGFFGLPWLLRTTAVETFSTDYGRELRIADIRTNPYALTLRIDGFELDDRDGEPLARFDRLLVDFTLLSLFNRAWTFETVDLDGLSIRAERFESGETRLGRLITDLAPAPSGSAEAAPPPDAATPRLVIRELRLDDGRLRFLDHVPDETFELAIDPVNIQVSQLDTRPDREGSQSVRMELGSGGTLDWQGRLQMVPFRARGRVELEGVVADGVLPYLQRIVPIHDLQLVFDTSFDYSASLPEGGPALAITNLEAEFRDLGLSAFQPQTEFLAAEVIQVESASYRHPENAVRIGAIRIEQPRASTWLTPAGQPGLLELLPDEPGPAKGNDDEPPGNPLSLELAELQVNGLDLDLADRSTDPPAPIGLRDMDLRLAGFNLEPGTEITTRLGGRLATGGDIAFNGRMRLDPAFDLQGDVRVSALDLTLAEPYLEQVARVRFDSGAVNLEGRLGIGPEEPLGYHGKASVEGLDVVTSAAGERVLGWEALRIEQLQLGLGARRLQTSRIAIEQPYANIAIAEDQSTNVGRLLVEAPADTPAEEEPGEPFAVTIDGIGIEAGEMDFSDRSLPLPFATRVRALNGRISTLASGSTEPASVMLEGRVGEYGLARIDGTINTWQPTRHTDLGIEFRNLEMPDYSPYTVQFAGRGIATGRMDLDLAYRIDEGQLEGSNDIILRDLELGEKVDSPDAADLPLGLAVALLKDSNGVIDIELPVSGDVNDPAFGIGGVVRQALVTLITRIVTSPFSLLGSLVGFESEDFGRIEFLPGRSDLTPPQREKITKLVAALGKRPGLEVSFAGTHDRRIDRPVLQNNLALAALRSRLEEDEAARTDLSLTDEAARKPLREIFREAYPDTDLDTIRAQFTLAPEDNPEGEPVLDEVAYHGHLARRVTEAQNVTEADLESLASARANAITSALLAGAVGDSADDGLRPRRVHVGDPIAVDAENDSRVPLEIGLATQ